MSVEIETAMVLAAGLGKRMRPLTDTMPKPMVPLAGRPLIDHVLNRLEEAGIKRAIVNVHYKADILEAHISARTRARRGPFVIVSNERGLLLETGGGVAKALPLLGSRPFLICNSDTTWVEQETRNLSQLSEAWNEEVMDGLLLLAQKDRSLGYAGDGDFHMAADGKLTRRAAGEVSPLVFAGVSIAHPRLFEDAPSGAFSLNVLWDRAISGGRLHGIALDGWWMHIGTPPALIEAERFITKLDAQGGDQNAI